MFSFLRTDPLHRLAIGLLCLLSFISVSGHARRPPIAVARESTKRIAKLKFGWPKFVRADPDLGNEAAKYYVLLLGEYTQKNWELRLNNERVKLSSRGRFEVRVALQSRVTELKFAAKGPRGEIQAETLAIYVVDWEGVLGASLFGRPKFELIPALGISYFSYQQTDQNDYNAFNLSAKGTLNWVYSPPNWQALLEMNGTLFSMTSNNTETAVRLMNIDLMTGYNFFFGTSGFSAASLVGAHYKHTFVDSDAFGYFNLFGPQLRILLNYQFDGGDAVMIYLKLGPLVRGGKLLSFKNFEFAQGLGPVFLLKNGHILPLLLETSFLTLDIDGRTANAVNAMITLGYSL